jgi:hypothetical protein
MPDLDDLEAVLHPATGPATPREDVETAIQALLFHQFIYADNRGAGRSYDLVRRHRHFFEAFFSAMGHRLLIEPREAMVGLLPGEVSYARQQTRLDRDETMALLALRFVLEAGVMQGRLTESGRVEATTDELFDAIKTVSRTEPPGEARTADILAGFRRRGLVRVEARDTAERVTPILVLPAVRHMCTDEFAGTSPHGSGQRRPGQATCSTSSPPKAGRQRRSTVRQTTRPTSQPRQTCRPIRRRTHVPTRTGEPPRLVLAGGDGHRGVRLRRASRPDRRGGAARRCWR